MEDLKTEKNSKLKKSLAICFSIIIMFSAVFTALYTTKQNMPVLAEEVQAQVSNVTEESVTILVNTYPFETVYKEFSVSIKAVDGTYTLAEEDIEKCLSYEISEDYSSVTVFCKQAFNGKVWFTVKNVKDPLVKDTCTFRYVQELLQPNYTLSFQRYEGKSDNRIYIEDEVFYLDGSNYNDSRDLEHGVSNGDWFTRPKENGLAPLYYDGQYRMMTYEHLFGKGDVINTKQYYNHFIPNEYAFNSLNSYAESHPTAYGVPFFYFNTDLLNQNRTTGDFNFSNLIKFDNDGYAYQINSYLNVLYSWMMENPEMCLVSLCHDSVENRAQVLEGLSNIELEYSHFYNKYFSFGVSPSSVELSQNEYIFND